MTLKVKSFLQFLTLLSHFLVVPAMADNSLTPSCSTKTLCRSYKTIDRLCYVERGTRTGLHIEDVAVAQSLCGYTSEKVYVKDENELSKHLEKLKNSCVIVKEFRIASHGSSSSSTTIFQPIYASNKDLSNLSCILSKNSVISFSSCNVGKGCGGDLALLRLAKVAFQGKNGKIKAPMSYLAGLAGTPIQFSLNGKWRTLNYSSVDKQTASIQLGVNNNWEKEESVRCSQELEELVAQTTLLRQCKEASSWNQSIFRKSFDKIVLEIQTKFGHHLDQSILYSSADDVQDLAVNIQRLTSLHDSLKEDTRNCEIRR